MVRSQHDRCRMIANVDGEGAKDLIRGVAEHRERDVLGRQPGSLRRAKTHAPAAVIAWNREQYPVNVSTTDGVDLGQKTIAIGLPAIASPRRLTTAPSRPRSTQSGAISPTSSGGRIDA